MTIVCDFVVGQPACLNQPRFILPDNKNKGLGNGKRPTAYFEHFLEIPCSSEWVERALKITEIS